jgi:PIN domain nuclease of toxin-antitoxin system
MTYVVDASALIALLRGEAGGERVREIVLHGENVCYAHGVNLCEVYYDFKRAGGDREAGEAIGAVRGAGIRFRPDMDAGFWMAAGVLKADRKRISLADCFALTLSKRLEAKLVTADRHELEPLTNKFDVIFIR